VAGRNEAGQAETRTQAAPRRPGRPHAAASRGSASGGNRTGGSQPPPDERLTFAEGATRYVEHVGRVLDRKPLTVQDYHSILRRHVKPFFSDRAVEAIGAQIIGDYAAAKSAEGLSPKTVTNHLRLLHAVFSYAVKRGWTHTNPVAAVDRPRVPSRDADIRFLTQEEVEALIAAVPDDALGPTDRALYLTAAFSGLRQGELIALRWRDIDWSVGLIRVRRSFTRGRFGTPKSRRSNRAVPMADRVASELASHLQASDHTADDDLVFGHPATGGPYDPSRMRKRFYDALSGAGVRRIRFHDLRNTFGTRMAAAGAPLRAIQEWMGHSNYQTTLAYADYAPDPSQGTAWAHRAFGSPGSPAEPTRK
jgi:integrase